MIGFGSYNMPIPWGSRVLGASPQKALDVHLVFSDVNIDHVLEAYDLFLRLRKDSPVLPLEERAFCGFSVFGVENWQVPWWMVSEQRPVLMSAEFRLFASIQFVPLIAS